ncbi:ABC transporter permease [Kaistia sp. 32K]|uniref:ABC transporter permease n=1 Tax=Kaistia sp. 32K TaxID=2795690 RepID=UPI0019158D70|nr:ABC transporter permease [Kaistia sp. 32K]BCP55249.1 ABC transporter permease [Kaistia sp. 32K]
MKAIFDVVALGAYRLALIAVMIFLIAPILITLSLSLDPRDLVLNFPPPGISLKWFERLFSNGHLLEGLKVSLMLAMATSVLVTLISLLAAIGIYRAPPRLRGAVESVISLPFIVPHMVVGFGLLLFLSLIGIENTVLRLILGHLIVTLPFGFRAICGAVFGVRKSLLEAAATLGANETRAVIDILLPLARPGVAASLVLAFALSLEEVTLSIFLIDARTYTFSTALFSSMRDTFNPEIAAASVALIVISGLLVIVMQKFIGLDRVVGSGGSVKG